MQQINVIVMRYHSKILMEISLDTAKPYTKTVLPKSGSYILTIVSLNIPMELDIMPLLKGKNNIGKNIKELESTGRKPKQSIAIALSVARKSGVKIKKSKSKKK